jgi:N-acetylneuraminic acid mutarotase
MKFTHTQRKQTASFGIAGSMLAIAPLWLMLAAANTSVSAQTNEWSWMGGSSKVDCSLPYGCSELGVYGTLGVPSAGNIPGGRYGPVTWTDKTGNFWLFSGDPSPLAAEGNPLGDVNHNDLWEFNPSTNQWTWVSGSNMLDQPGVYGTLGVPSAENIPAARSLGVGWTDKSGNFWVFSGYGNCSWLNDLWRYNPSTNQWTWMNGSSTCGQAGVYGTLGTPAAGNTPGARQGAISWTDKSGNFWLFGGQGYTPNGFGILNDMWEYDPSTNEWTWVGGSNLTYQSGVYGTLGTPAAGNIPGGRWGSTSWTDNSGNLWLLGGNGVDRNGSSDYLNDLWKFDPSTKQWTWVSGAATIDQPGVYGTLGVPSSENTPGALANGFTWTDSSGNLWLFGGSGFDASGGFGNLNELMKFNPATNLWTWIGGGTSEGNSGVYGTLGTPAAGNIPGGHSQGAHWIDNSGNFWLFGGYGIDALGINYGFYSFSGIFNDLWRYQLSSVSLPAAATPAFSVPAGTYTAEQTVAISDTTSGATIYYSTNGTSPAPVWTVYSAPITVSSTETIEAIAMGSGHSTSAVAAAAYTILGSADLYLRIRPTTTTVHQGDLLTYAFPVWNLGPDIAAQEVLNTQVPAGTVFDYIRISGTPGLGTCTYTPYLGAGPIPIVCHENSVMALNTTWTVRLTVKVTAPAGTVITESAATMADTPDPNLANNKATVSLTVVP